MSMNIQRKSDNQAFKCLLHRTADIPGGVGVSVSTLGGSLLLEGTPLGKGKDGLYEVCKTVRLLTKAEASVTSYEVAKGHHFREGDHFAIKGCKGQPITAIDRSNPDKDIITLSATLGKAVTAGECAFESKGASTEARVLPIAVAGSTEDIVAGENLWVSAWVIGVVREAIAPATDEATKSALKGIVYV